MSLVATSASALRSHADTSQGDKHTGFLKGQAIRIRLAAYRYSDWRLCDTRRNRPRDMIAFISWARQDSNLGPRDYESPALTAELQAHLPSQYFV